MRGKLRWLGYPPCLPRRLEAPHRDACGVIHAVLVEGTRGVRPQQRAAVGAQGGNGGIEGRGEAKGVNEDDEPGA